MRQPHKVLTPRTEGVQTRPSTRNDVLLLNSSAIATMAVGVVPRRGDAMKDVGLVENGGIYCLAGKIAEVGDSNTLKSRYPNAASIIDAGGKFVTPGFVDPHTHVVFAGSRENELEMKLRGATYQEIADSGGGLLSTVTKTRAASVDDLIRESKPKLRGMLTEGTTTAEAKSGYGLDVQNELKILSAIDALGEVQPMRLVPTFLGAHAIPPEFAGRADAYIDMLAGDMLPLVARRTAARFCDVWVEDGYFTAEQGKRLLTQAKLLGLASKVHADELSSCGGAELAAEMGAASADHLLHPSDAGLESLAQSNCVAVLLPAASMSSRLPYADARRVISAGIPVAIGTDLNPGCWVESMQFVVSLAVHQLRMTPAEAMTAATINAAHAIGLAGKVGSIEPGKSADFLILDTDKIGDIGYRFGRNLAEVVVKAGKVVVDKRSR